MLFYRNSSGANMKIWTEFSTGLALLFLQAKKPCSGGGRSVHFLSIKTADWAHIPVWTSLQPLFLPSAHPRTPPLPPIVRIGLAPHSLPSHFSAYSESRNEWTHDCWKRTPMSCLIISRPYKSPLRGLALWLSVLDWTLHLYCQLTFWLHQHGQKNLNRMGNENVCYYSQLEMKQKLRLDYMVIVALTLI